MRNIPSCDAWLKTFAASVRGKHALSELNRHFPPDQESEQTRQLYPLRDAVLSSCYYAAMFDPEQDPSKKERVKDSKGLKALESQRTTIAILQKFATQYRKIAGMAFIQTITDLKAEGIIIRDSKTREGADVLICILEALSRRFVAPIPLVAAGPLLSRAVFGCLHYDPPLDDGKHNRHPDVQTMLIFDLVQTFRLRSNGILVRQLGQPMPKAGKPLFALVADFVSATFPKGAKLKGDAARARLKDFLRKNPNVGYIPWSA